MHIFIQHDKNVYFFVKYILGIYHVYTRFGNDKGIYLVYTWYIPGKTFQGFPDVQNMLKYMKQYAIKYAEYAK